MYQRLAGDDDRLKLRGPIERAVFAGSKHGFRSVGVANRTFAGNPKRSTPDRPSTGGEGSGLFDLNPTDEQKMIVDTTREFAAEKLRPAATAADTEAAPQCWPSCGSSRGVSRRTGANRKVQQ